MGTRSKKDPGAELHFAPAKATPWEEYHAMFVDEEGDLHEGATVWCLHCERAYPMAEMVKAEGMWWCKYHPECDGAMLDVKAWSWVRENNPEYPEVPVVGEEYPLYGKKGE